MSAEHTLGPCEAKGTGVFGPRGQPLGFSIESDCDVARFAVGASEAEANARLWASAPEAVEALREVERGECSIEYASALARSILNKLERPMMLTVFYREEDASEKDCRRTDYYARIAQSEPWVLAAPCALGNWKTWKEIRAFCAERYDVEPDAIRFERVDE